MRSVAVTILYAFSVQVYATKVQERIPEGLAVKLLDRALKAASETAQYSDDTMLGKPVNLPRSSVPLRPRTHPVVTRTGRSPILGSIPSPTQSVRSCPFTGADTVNTVSTTSTEFESIIAKDGSSTQSDFTPIPGPKGLPFDFLQNSYHVLKIPIYGIEEATLRWGNSFGPIVRYDNKNLGIKSWVFVNEPELIEHVCGRKASNYAERYLPDVYKFATQGKGILGSSGKFNKEHRAMCKGPFQSKRILRQFAEKTTAITSELVKVWRESSDSGVVMSDIAEHMQRLTLDVIGNVSFSYNFGGMDHVRRELAGSTKEDTEQDKLIDYVNRWTSHVGAFALPFFTNDMLKLGTKLGYPRLTDLQVAIKGMRSILMRIIEERRQQIRKAEDVPEDLMTTLIRIQQDTGEANFTDTDLWEDIHDVMGAGHETTANTLTTALWEISMHPEVGVRVQDELDALCGTGPDRRLPTYEDYESGKLQYTTQVIKEVLRLYPPIPLFVRETAKTDKLPGGYVIQEGDTVFMSAYALGRTERFWPNAYQFDPDRFTPENEEARGKWTWLPFGAGPRMCMGSGFALMSTVLQFAVIMQSYSFTNVRPNYRSNSQGHIPYIGAWRGGMPFEYDMTISFPEGCTLEAVPRQPA